MQHVERGSGEGIRGAGQNQGLGATGTVPHRAALLYPRRCKHCQGARVLRKSQHEMKRERPTGIKTSRKGTNQLMLFADTLRKMAVRDYPRVGLQKYHQCAPTCEFEKMGAAASRGAVAWPRGQVPCNSSRRLQEMTKAELIRGDCRVLSAQGTSAMTRSVPFPL